MLAESGAKLSVLSNPEEMPLSLSIENRHGRIPLGNPIHLRRIIDGKEILAELDKRLHLGPKNTFVSKISPGGEPLNNAGRIQECSESDQPNQATRYCRDLPGGNFVVVERGPRNPTNKKTQKRSTRKSIVRRLVLK